MYLPKNLQILRKFNRLPLTGGDFVELCSENNIEVVISPEPKRGYYYYADGMHTIVLSSRLSAEQRRFVGWHEFAHFLQNYYPRRETKMFSSESTKAQEKLADVFALIATRPHQIRITRGLQFIDMLMRPKFYEQKAAKTLNR